MSRVTYALRKRASKIELTILSTESRLLALYNFAFRCSVETLILNKGMPP